MAMTWAALERKGEDAKSEGRTQPSSCKSRQSKGRMSYNDLVVEGRISTKGTHHTLENNVQSDGSDKGADPTLAVVRLNAQAVLRDVLVVEDHGFRHVAISQTVVGKKKRAGKEQTKSVLGTNYQTEECLFGRTHWIMAGRPKHAPLCLSQQYTLQNVLCKACARGHRSVTVVKAAQSKLEGGERGRDRPSELPSRSDQRSRTRRHPDGDLRRRTL